MPRCKKLESEKDAFGFDPSKIDREGKTFPGAASLAIKASPGISNGYLSIRSLDDSNASSLTDSRIQLPRKNSVRIVEGLVPGRYSVSLMKVAGARYVRIGIQKVELEARELKQIEFPRPKGVQLKGKVSGMARRGLTEAVFSLHRKDDQWKKKSMAYVEADDAVSVSQDGEFQTDQLKEGWYEWSLGAYAPDHGPQAGKPYLLRSPGYRMTGEVYVPASGEANVRRTGSKAWRTPEGES